MGAEFPRPSGQPPIASAPAAPAGWPGCALRVLAGFPSNDQENLARWLFIPRPLFACADP